MLTAGDRAGPYELVIDAESAAAFGEATLDHNPRYFDGTALPPTAIATQTYRTQFAAMLELVPESVFAEAHGGVHGQHELLLHRPIVPDETLRTIVETYSARSSGGNLRITLLHKTYDAEENLVAEQWWTTVMLGATADPTGPALPDHAVAAFGNEHLIAEEVVRIDQDMARRYGHVSGDFSEHHFDAEAARRSGYEGPFLHGLCTMALSAASSGQDGVRRRSHTPREARRPLCRSCLPRPGPRRPDLRPRRGSLHTGGNLRRGYRRPPWPGRTAGLNCIVRESSATRYESWFPSTGLLGICTSSPAGVARRQASDTQDIACLHRCEAGAGG